MRILILALVVLAGCSSSDVVDERTLNQFECVMDADCVHMTGCHSCASTCVNKQWLAAQDFSDSPTYPCTEEMVKCTDCDCVAGTCTTTPSTDSLCHC